MKGHSMLRRFVFVLIGALGLLAVGMAAGTAERLSASGLTLPPKRTSPPRDSDWPTPRNVAIHTEAEPASPRPPRMPIIWADMPELRMFATVAIRA